ncbi:MAG TPA: M28 family peptidase, partial [Thermoleophilaceae bacterium]|nr:M28 family peptidase [Thermoleophilaceae bacterium]
GSRRYVRSLSRSQRRRIEAYLNLDMVGSPNARPTVSDSREASGTARAASRRLERLLRRRLGSGVPHARTGGASDHAPFAAAGIPVGGIYTGGPEQGLRGRPRDPCYHRACDTVRNVNRRVLRRMARAAAGAVAELARAQAK